ncbi:HAD hydrolase-like protein [Methylobacterium radiotolerans]|jgi:phosphoglycolate phosphatase|uniref:HAD hydrolase-like protein n=1 Tax=Methylobacterium TaxID=407 RepID=UPI0005E7E400|nr:MULTISPECIES: HAD hydrolase-like protein [Methylobacterium]MBN6821079.1 HAD hydrolase-like protein [Methylobacterium organophilum]OXE43252.1 HAD family hydrolase [Methylobacterium radiotolerans]GAN49582.1 HAD family hydrolase [Methylobacterium sp. ME121]
MTRMPARMPAAPGPGLVVLDFDGTLADSFAWFCSVLNGVADRYRFRRVEAHEVEELRLQGARAIVAHLGIPRWKLPLIARHMHALAARDAAQIALFPGVPAMLDAVAEAGVPLAILSSNRADTVRRVLGPDSAARIGTYACGASIFGKARRLRALLARTGVAPHRALCIGDEIRDLEAARALGCPFGAVAWGYTDPRTLASLGPEHLFSEPGEIARLAAGGAGHMPRLAPGTMLVPLPLPNGS